MGRSIRVMVVDDTDHVRQMLASMLTLDGFEVVEEVERGNEAERSSDGDDPDVVDIDYRKPGIYGTVAAATAESGWCAPPAHRPRVHARPTQRIRLLARPRTRRPCGPGSGRRLGFLRRSMPSSLSSPLVRSRVECRRLAFHLPCHVPCHTGNCSH